MNFDFIKTLDGLNRVLCSCNNAEELAKTKPDLSMVASRKSAEEVARLVYLAAHAECFYNLSFNEVLLDSAVQKYLKKKSILDAFHYIRINGNNSVHKIESESSDKAIVVLSKLHYVLGEVAKRMGKIKEYPHFNANIPSNPKAVLVDMGDPGELALKMYKECFVAEDRANRVFEEFKELRSPFVFHPGQIDLNETLQFDKKPVLKSTIPQIQEHFGFLALQAARNIRSREPENEFLFDAEITVFGKEGYSVSSLDGFMDALEKELPNADGFKISTTYHGPSDAPWFNHEVRKDFYEVISEIGKEENFTYTFFEFLYNHGEGQCRKFKNGAWLDFENTCTPDIANKERPLEWFSWNLNLITKFDFGQYPEIIDSLHNTVRKHIPEDEIRYCEQAWKDNEQEILINGIQWCTKNLRDIQFFLDEINDILRPIKSECECIADGVWYYTEAPFAVAVWEWTDDGFKVVGMEC